jgi:CheY-like chemotaxis protein
MPDLTGMDVYERLAAAAPDQAAKMIFVTASATTNRARAFVAAMANRVLEKPFDVAQLRRVVRELGARDAAVAR